jgi:pro-kumamolisin-like protein/Big-like domain-containing protein
MRGIPVCSSFSLCIALTLVATIPWASTLCAPALGQESATAAAADQLITQPIDETNLTVLKGNTHPLARPELDLGTAPATLPMERMLLVLKRSPGQETALRKLLDDQQDKASANYHRWLTPDQFGKQFGPAESDMQTITLWLQSHGFQVGSTKGRTVLEFSGSASQVQEAFHTTIHKYIVNGQQQWANASDPSIPTALTPAVAGVLTLHNFLKKPTIHFTGERVPAKLVGGKKPKVTFPPQNGEAAINALGPQDYAVIYNINPVYANGITGNGIQIGVVGRSNLYGGQDVQDFRNVLGAGNGALGAVNFGVVLNGPDPGDLGGGEEAEATLDSTWSSAIAPGAYVSLIVSASTNTTDGIDLSEADIIENDSYDIMTESFSACELYATDAQLAGQSAMAEQAAAQGITYLVSTGDDGAEGCDDPSTAPATDPISVNYLASTGFNIAVGGTMFNENGDPSKYWASTAPLSETALSYIPEDVWNESSLTNGLWSSSGGASTGNVQSGYGTTPGVPKPSWQYGVTGIPQDNVRDLPDVSLTAAGHDPYILCLEASCEPNSQGEIFVYFISGTSASAPSFAGIMALVDNQISGTSNNIQFTRQGLANYVLYRLAATQSSYPSQCNGSNTSTPSASTCIFNDVTVGNNVVPGEVGTDYQAGPGYDMATGLGSMNVSNLVNGWDTVNFSPTTTTLTFTTSTITHGSSVPFSVYVSANSGTGTPSGEASLLIYDSDVGGLVTGAAGPWALSGGTVSASTSVLPGGAYPVSARYAGDGTYAPSISAGSSYIDVYPEPSTTAVSVLTANQSGQAIPFSTGPFGSFVYLRSDVAGQSGQGVPSGKVTFSDTFGTIPGSGPFPYELPLNSQGNTATPNGILNFDAGTHTISASYSGDPSFNPSSTTQSQTFTITPGFYASISAPTLSISAPGSSGQTGVTVSNSTGFSGTISLACSGLPSEATCTFTPGTITASGTANATTATIAVATTAATATLHSRPQPFLLAQWMIGTALLVSVVIIGGKQQRLRGLFLLLIVAGTVVVPSCGGGGSSSGGSSSAPPTSNPGTPAGNYTVTVTATSGSTVSKTGFTLVVQ